jgi:hypothetical protein
MLAFQLVRGSVPGRGYDDLRDKSGVMHSESGQVSTYHDLGFAKRPRLCAKALSPWIELEGSSAILGRLRRWSRVVE